MAGISNVEIEKFFHNETNDDFKEKFLGVHSSNSITRFINYFKIIKEKDRQCPFAIFNTDRANKPETHWWSFLSIYPKTELFLFDSEGFEGLKFFITDDDEAIINKLLYNLNKFNEKDKNVKIILLKFSADAYRKLKKNEIFRVTDTAKDFFHLLSEFARVNNLTHEMTVVMVDDELQELYSETCGVFQLYFYKHLFDPDENSKILIDEHLTKKTVETLLNETFTKDKNENERRISEFAKEHCISVD